MDWIDENRGEQSRQTFVIKIVAKRMKTDPNCLEKQDDKERKESCCKNNSGT